MKYSISVSTPNSRFAATRGVLWSLALSLVLGTAAFASAAPPAAPKDAPSVTTLGSFNDGYRFGMTKAELSRTVVGYNGLIDKDYDAQLRKASPGVQQRSLETERDAVKRAFERNAVEFNSTPSGLDNTALGKEYTYGNRESLLTLQTQGRRRHYFFINDKLWKVYDEVVLGGPAAMGATFGEVEAKLATKFAVQPRRGTEAGYPQLDWQDATTHLRLIDRSGENVVGVVLEDRATVAMLPQLRTNKPADLFAVDPSILAVTKGGLSDPNKQNAPEPQPEEKGKGKKKGKK